MINLSDMLSICVPLFLIGLRVTWDPLFSLALRNYQLSRAERTNSVNTISGPGLKNTILFWPENTKKGSERKTQIKTLGKLRSFGQEKGKERGISDSQTELKFETPSINQIPRISCLSKLPLLRSTFSMQILQGTFLSFSTALTFVHSLGWDEKALKKQDIDIGSLSKGLLTLIQYKTIFFRLYGKH